MQVMDCQTFSSDLTIIVAGDIEEANKSVTVRVINELSEKINNLQCELEHLKRRETTPNALFQQDLNKIKTGIKVCSNAIQSTNNLFKITDKKNTETSNELKALKREVNKCFDEEKNLGKRRNELLYFLNEGMGKMQNGTKQLFNEIKNVRDSLKTTSSATQNTKDLLKNSDKRITETSNKVKALEKEISNCLLVRNERYNYDSFVKEEDLTILRNGVLNVYSKGMQQVHERSKEMGKEIKKLHERLKKQQEKVDNVVQSTTSIKNQHKDMNKKQTMMENSIKQFSNEIKKIQTELRAEQQKNIILENKLITFECQLKEIFLRNDITQNHNKETCIKGEPAVNTFPQKCDFVTETCILTISELKTKKNVSGQLGAQSELLIRDNSKWMDVASKDPDDISVAEETKHKYVRVGINQSANKEQESIDSLLLKEESLYEQESSVSPVHSQNNRLNENECLDLAYDSTYGEVEPLSYLEKAYTYLQNLQMPGMFTFSDEESMAVSDEESSTEANEESSVTFEPGNNTEKRSATSIIDGWTGIPGVVVCGEGKKKKRKSSRKKKVGNGDAILSDKIEWVIRRNVTPWEDISYQSRVFYTGTPGYRFQVLAKIDRPEGEIFFSLRVLKGVYDENLEWPCRQGISIKVSQKMQSTGVECWFIPEEDVLTKPMSKKDKVYTKWFGPLNLGHYLNSEKLIFDIYLG